MASLALLASLVALSVILSGPICLLLSKIQIIPNIIVYLFSLLTIFIGVWFFLLPIAGIRWLGLVSAGLGLMAINQRREGNKKLMLDKGDSR